MKDRTVQKAYLVATFVLSVFIFAPGANAVGLTPVNSGMAGNLVVLSEIGVSNMLTAADAGDIGVSPLASAEGTGYGLTRYSPDTFSRSSLESEITSGADDVNRSCSISRKNNACQSEQ